MVTAMSNDERSAVLCRYQRLHRPTVLLKIVEPTNPRASPAKL